VKRAHRNPLPLSSSAWSVLQRLLDDEFRV
jgi:hypothetical protein